MPELSVVIPVYKAHEILDELTRQLLAALEGMSDDFEIIYVEDHGQDGSWERVAELAARDPRIKGIKLVRNFGQHFALSAGLEACAGDWVIIMDCDLQDPPQEMPRLLEKAREGYDIVLARRIGRNDGFMTHFMSYWFYKVFDFFSGAETDPTVGAFRILSRKAVDGFRSMPERHRYFGGMIQWLGFPTAFIDVQRADRHSGKSSYTRRKQFGMAVEAILSFSNKPLELMVRGGLIIIVLSAIFTLTVIYQRVTGTIAETGFAGIIASLYFLSGVILMSVGLVGLYVGRIYEQVKQRPVFLIDRTTFGD